jgi:hypothetical protein
LGHTENLLMGYQVVFTITIAALALFGLLIAYSVELDSSWVAVCGAVLLVPIALGGWLGLVFVPPLGTWAAWQWWRARGAGLLALAILAAAAAYLSWSVWFLLASGGAIVVEEVPSTLTRIKAMAGVMGIGLGPGVGRHVKLWAIGAALLLIQAATIRTLIRVGVRRPAERHVAWGLVAIMLGVWAFAFAVGFSRGTGLASRYSAFTAFGIAVPLLASARYARPSVLVTVLVFLVGALVVIANERHGRWEGSRLDECYRSVVADRDAGVPIDLLAERHQDFWIGPDEGWRALWENGFPLLRGVPPASSRAVHPVAFRRDGEVTDGRAVFCRYRVEPSGKRSVVAVRVRFRASVWVPWERMSFIWIDPASGERRRSEVRPWVRPVDQSVVFWIDGHVARGELLIGRMVCPIEILGIEAIER